MRPDLLKKIDIVHFIEPSIVNSIFYSSINFIQCCFCLFYRRVRRYEEGIVLHELHRLFVCPADVATADADGLLLLHGRSLGQKL